MAAANTTNYIPALKELYDQDTVNDLTYRNAGPLFMFANHDENFVGRQKRETLIFGEQSGHSADFSVAQANKNPLDIEGFTISRYKYYSIASIDSELMLAAASDAGSVLDSIEAEINGALISGAHSIGRYSYGDGSGTIGAISSTTTLSGTTIILDTLSDIVNFERNQKLQLADTTTSGLRDSGATVTVTGVNSATGTITVSVATSTAIPSAAVGDLIFIQGTYNNVIQGSDAWVPTTDPGATAFNGVDRTQHLSRLSGVRVSGSGKSRSDALIDFCARMGREGRFYSMKGEKGKGVPGSYITPKEKGGRAGQYPRTTEADFCCFTSFEDFAGLQKEGDARLDISKESMSYYAIGYSGIGVDTAIGRIEIYPDYNCPQNILRGYHRDVTWFRSMGPMPRLLDLDGNKMLREGTADAVEIRCAYYGNFTLGRGPGMCGVITDFGL